MEGIYDVYLSHYPGGWKPQTYSWTNVKRFYGDRLSEPYTMVVPTRDPLPRFMSHCRYFTGKQLKKNREKTLQSMLTTLQNYMLQYMGVFNATAYRSFVLSDDFWQLNYVPSELFDEGMVLLAR